MDYVKYSPAPTISGEVMSTADVTLSTSAPTLLPGITTTLPIGSYLIWFTTSMTSDGTNATSTFGLYVNGTLKADSLRTIQPYDGGALSAATANGAAAINALIVLATAVPVQIRAECTGGGTAVAHQSTMTWLKVA